MKTVLSRAKRENHLVNDARLIIKWSISRGRDTYGYNICSLYIDGVKAAGCNGGGYDMTGFVIGQWIEQTFPEQLKKLTANYGSSDNRTGFYGLGFHVKTASGCKLLKHWRPGASVTVDGSCGQSSMEAILRKIGFRLEYQGKYPGDRCNAQYAIRSI